MFFHQHFVLIHYCDLPASKIESERAFFFWKQLQRSNQRRFNSSRRRAELKRLREVRWSKLAALFLPGPDEGFLIIADNDARIRSPMKNRRSFGLKRAI